MPEERDAWRGFAGTGWREAIDVAGFGIHHGDTHTPSTITSHDRRPLP
jgi:hypothetical protein